MKKSRPERDYGLPALTLEEAARVLSVTPAEFMNWIATKVRPTPQMWTNWNRPGAHLPESLIRLYLTEKQGRRPDRPREPSSAVPAKR